MTYSTRTYADRQLVLRLMQDGLLTPEEITAIVLDLVARVDREEDRHPGQPFSGDR